jgi:hypothetical protein
MSDICSDIHHIFQNLKRYKFPFSEANLPKNGIYILFEKNELAHNGERIIRVGTHTGNDNLVKRLKEHFMKENKDRSIFRKNIGRAILHKKDDPFLEQWNWDLTTRVNKDKYSPLVDFEKQKSTEEEVSQYIKNNFSFAIFEVKSKNDRLNFESKIISTISLCENCKPSSHWLGEYSPIQKIKESGLWLVQGLYKTPLNTEDIERIKSLLSQNR